MKKDAKYHESIKSAEDMLGLLALCRAIDKAFGIKVPVGFIESERNLIEAKHEYIKAYESDDE